MSTTRQADPEFRLEPLLHETLDQRVYRELADMILDGVIAPGQWVTIQSLAKGFGVSATPVREALKRLTEANALQVVSGRSIGIPPLSIERLTDLRNVRIEVEGVATRWAAERVDPRMLSSIESKLAHMNSAIVAEDVHEYLRTNRAFHFEIYRGAGSPTLLSLIEILWLQISPYFNLLRKSGGFTSSNRLHETIVVAFRHGDALAAQQAMRADIQFAFETLSKLLR
jgi:DNA-binding GntR family transcriptional regulator